MVVAPSEIFLPLAAIQSVELPIIAVPLTQVEPVCAIFVDVVDVIVAPISIVIPLLKVVVRASHRNQERGAQQQSTENQNTLHLFETSIWKYAACWPIAAQAEIAGSKPVDSTISGHLTTYRYANEVVLVLLAT